MKEFDLHTTATAPEGSKEMSMCEFAKHLTLHPEQHKIMITP
ncbi:MAG: hypothetical protein ACUVQ1_09530 [Candidatus Kapaibacteriales bacterium]